MKSRLQALWDQVSPEGGPCPQPDVKRVRQLVDAALDKDRRTLHLGRKLKLTALCAAALVLLTGAAAVADVVLPAHNVLSVFFRGENAPGAERLVDAQPVSVSDENYTLTVTTSVADGSDVYFTLLIEAKTLKARLWLSSSKLMDGALVIDIPRDSGGTATHTAPYDPATHTRRVDVDATVGRTRRISVRLDGMEEGLWLRFTVKPAAELRLKIGAEGWGTGPSYDPDRAEGPLTLKTVTLSPLSCRVEYTAGQPEVYPVLRFLWKDGAVSALSDFYAGRGSGHVSRRGEVYVCEHTWPFSAVQDLSRLEAVVFEGVAYPLDHSEPYEVDLDALPIREAQP